MPPHGSFFPRNKVIRHRPATQLRIEEFQDRFPEARHAWTSDLRLFNQQKRDKMCISPANI